MLNMHHSPELITLFKLKTHLFDLFHSPPFYPTVHFPVLPPPPDTSVLLHLAPADSIEMCAALPYTCLMNLFYAAFRGFKRKCEGDLVCGWKKGWGREKKRCKRWAVSKFVMRLAGLLLAHKQTRTSVMSVAEAAGRGCGGHVANLNRAKSFNVSCPLSRAAAQQGMPNDDCLFLFFWVLGFFFFFCTKIPSNFMAAFGGWIAPVNCNNACLLHSPRQ